MKKLQLYNIFGRKVKATLGGSEGGSGVTVVANETELESVIEEGKLYYVEADHDFAYLDNTDNIAYVSEFKYIHEATECIITSNNLYDKINHIKPYTFYRDCLEVATYSPIPTNQSLVITLEGSITNDLYYWRFTVPSDNFSIHFIDATPIIPQSTQDVLSSLEEDHTYEFNLFAGVLNVIDVTPASTE